MKFLMSFVAALMLASPVLAQDMVVNGIHIIHPFVTAPAAGAMAGAGYLQIINEGTAADRLTAVETDVAMMAALHETSFGTDGVARMFELPPVVLEPGQSVTFAPGGAHIMLMMMTKTLNLGDKVQMSLFFDKAGQIDVEFSVE